MSSPFRFVARIVPWKIHAKDTSGTARAMHDSVGTAWISRVERQTSNEGDGDALLRAGLFDRRAGGGSPRIVRNCGGRRADLMGALRDRPGLSDHSRGDRTPNADAMTSDRCSSSLVVSPARVMATRA